MKLPLLYKDRYWLHPTHGTHRFCHYEDKDVGLFIQPHELQRAGRGTGRTTRDIERCVKAPKDETTLVLLHSMFIVNMFFHEVFDRVVRLKLDSINPNLPGYCINFHSGQIVFRHYDHSFRGIHYTNLIIDHELFDICDYGHALPIIEAKVKRSIQLAKIGLRK